MRVAARNSTSRARTDRDSPANQAKPLAVLEESPALGSFCQNRGLDCKSIIMQSAVETRGGRLAPIKHTQSNLANNAGSGPPQPTSSGTSPRPERGALPVSELSYGPHDSIDFATYMRLKKFIARYPLLARDARIPLDLSRPISASHYSVSFNDSNEPILLSLHIER